MTRILVYEYCTILVYFFVRVLWTILAFNYIMATSFSGRRSWSTQRETSSIGKQLVNWIIWTWRQQYSYASIVHNTRTKKYTSIVQYSYSLSNTINKKPCKNTTQAGTNHKILLNSFFLYKNPNIYYFFFYQKYIFIVILFSYIKNMCYLRYELLILDH
jgi:ABC-type glycerol-3-phosphate transport system permease component